MCLWVDRLGWPSETPTLRGNEQVNVRLLLCLEVFGVGVGRSNQRCQHHSNFTLEVRLLLGWGCSGFRPNVGHGDRRSMMVFLCHLRLQLSCFLRQTSLWGRRVALPGATDCFMKLRQFHGKTLHHVGTNVGVSVVK